MTCDSRSVVIVPFPFTDKRQTKRRPALVLSRRVFNQNGYSILAMITTKSKPAWAGDFPISDLRSIGLNVPCLVRLKLFTLDNRLIVKQIGKLADSDYSCLSEALHNQIDL